jgi:glycosyltransferase involved in cell wall biosynthesis
MEVVDFIDYGLLHDSLVHKYYMVSSGLHWAPVLHAHIGFVDHSFNQVISPTHKFPTWQMSTKVGAIHAEVLNRVKDHIDPDQEFAYFLNSIAKLLKPKGLFTYHIPQVLHTSSQDRITPEPTVTLEYLHKFVAEHFKKGWLFFLVTCMVKFKKEYAISLVIKNTFKTKKVLEIELDDLQLVESKIGNLDVNTTSIDVIIPTLGRKTYLHQVLIDFKGQTKLPDKIIIVEQNPDIQSVSELDYLTNDEWPFEIVHKFIHQTGACNARNVALDQITAPYVFLFDDDARLDPTTVERGLTVMFENKFDCINFSYLQANETENETIFRQWETFGSGCAIIPYYKITYLRFDMIFEHGYGEDADFGMQLRMNGLDIIYTPNLRILHLKAPTGGFRSINKFPWSNDRIQPKPSPQIMCYKLKHATSQQLLGYKLLLFINFYKKQKDRNPFSYYRNFNKSWRSSLFYAKELMSHGKK